ncbi:hypothetical protein LSH36_1238g00041 [Paralvinella palmiformis]|uniref:G-protein coupled receptors family 1 profile domain-containing protein n=1 Tax=Paralvinella palmiformis TaxID=53620 RepID=A0AAD9ITZ3_9ANNE|nr:hypothetical protein LSH36_1238g00041 [Paralvinella palmiformis]
MEPEFAKELFWQTNRSMRTSMMNSEVMPREQLTSSGLALPIVKAVFVSVLFTTGIAANLLVFAVFYHKPVLLTTSNKLLTHQSVIQCLLLLLVVPLWTASIFEVSWSGAPHACLVSGIAVNTLFAAASYTLVLVALDRFCAITKPLHYTRTVTIRRVAVGSASVWLLSLLISVPPLVGWGTISFSNERGICLVDSSSPTVGDRSYAVFVAFACFVAPLAAQISLYGVIYCSARRTTSRAKRHSLTPDHHNGYDVNGYVLPPRRRSSTLSLAQMISRRRSSFSVRSLSSLQRDDLMAAKTALMAVLSFVVCWSPFYLLNAVDVSLAPIRLPGWVHFVALFLVVLSCLVNPVVYVFRSKIVKDTLCVRGYLGLVCQLCPCAVDDPDGVVCNGRNPPFPPLLRIAGRVATDPGAADIFETSEVQSEVRQIVTSVLNPTTPNHDVV